MTSLLTLLADIRVWALEDNGELFLIVTVNKKNIALDRTQINEQETDEDLIQMLLERIKP